MTDGRSTVNTREMSKEEAWGWNNGSRVAFEHMEHVCTRMKKEGIELFILRLPGNDHSKPYLERCASSSAHYLESGSASDLPQLIGKIRDQMEDELRLIY